MFVIVATPMDARIDRSINKSGKQRPRREPIMHHFALLLAWLLTSMPLPNRAKSNEVPKPVAGLKFDTVGGGYEATTPADAGRTRTGMIWEVTGSYWIAEQGAHVTADAPEDADGASRAPVCALQFPSLLDKYRDRPPWRVAGVHYCVGYPTNMMLKDPSTISMEGVTLDKANHLVMVTGNNVTLDGYDFSLNGGWGIVIRGANTKILDSNFLVGSNSNKPILATVSSSNLSVAYCMIDGHNDSNVSGLIEDRGSGTLTVQYCWLKNAGGDMIQMHNNDQPASLVAEYNLLQNAGMSAGAHGDYTEFSGGPYTATIRYNTTVQHGGSTQGFMVEPDNPGGDKGVIVSGEIGNNTFTGSVNAFTAVTVADIVNTFTVHDNYFDPTQTTFGQGLAFGGVRGGPNDGSAKSIYVHNVNMTNGVILQDSIRIPKTRSR